MTTTGKISGITKDLKSGKTVISFEVEHINKTDLEELYKCEKLEISAKKWRNHRSKDANALLWACLGEIAKAMNPPVDKWEIYLQCLKRYGKYSYVVVRPEAVEKIKQIWRECEVVGDISVNGQKATQILCYYGSSTYDSKEMSILLNGVISEMKEMGLPEPPSGEMKRLIEEMEKREHAQANP